MHNGSMQRLPLLLIAIFCLAIACLIVFFGINLTMTPVQHQHAAEVQVFSFLPIAFLGAMLLGFLIWVLALIHMLTNQSIQGTDKIVWALVIIFLNVLGAILYFLLSPTLRLSSPSIPIPPK